MKSYFTILNDQKKTLSHFDVSKLMDIVFIKKNDMKELTFSTYFVLS